MLGGFASLPLRHNSSPTTGWSAAAHARAAADLAAAKRIAPFAVLTFTCATTIITLHACYSMLDVSAASALTPVLTSPSTGVVLITFLPQAADEYDISGAICIRHARAVVHGSTARKRTVELVSPNSVRVRIFDASGSAVDGKATLKVS